MVMPRMSSYRITLTGGCSWRYCIRHKGGDSNVDLSTSVPSSSDTKGVLVQHYMDRWVLKAGH